MLKDASHDARAGAMLSLSPRAEPDRWPTSALTAGGEGTLVALTGGYHLAFWIAGGLVAVAIAVVLTVLRPGD